MRLLLTCALLLASIVAGCGGGERADPQDLPTVGDGPRAVVTPRPAATALPAGDQVRAGLRDLRGVPQSGSLLGRRSAPVTLTVYASMNAFADRFFRRDLPEVLRRFVRPRSLRLVLVPVPDGARARLGARYAAVAGLSDRMWQFWAALSARFETEISPDSTERAIREAGVRGQRVASDLRSRRVARRVRGFGRDAPRALPAYTVRAGRGSAQPLDACGGLCLVQALAPVVEEER